MTRLEDLIDGEIKVSIKEEDDISHFTIAISDSERCNELIHYLTYIDIDYIEIRDITIKGKKDRKTGETTCNIMVNALQTWVDVARGQDELFKFANSYLFKTFMNAWDNDEPIYVSASSPKKKKQINPN